jgi:hypothetical protein
MKENRKYILLLIATILLVVAVEWLSPKPINWTATYSQDDKNPFGAYILHDLLPSIFPGKEIQTLDATLYEQDQMEELNEGNYIFIAEDLSLGEEDMDILLRLAKDGNNIFIAAQTYPQYLKDTLHFDTENIFFVADTLGLNLAHPALKTTSGYNYRRVETFYAFRPLDKKKKATYQVLGHSHLKEANFIKIKFGRGNFYLNTVPQAYTNYNMLYGQNATYISKTLSYLPIKNTYWDEYYKGFHREPQTPLRFIIGQPALKWALYLTLSALVLFMLFEAKRKQRIIPIIKPLTNATVEFTETVGRLYFQYKDHKNIAEKKITYFLDYLRTRFYVKTNEFNEELYSKLADKTGVSQEDIVKLFQLITSVRSRKSISEQELMALNTQIEDFQKKNR